MDWIEGESTEVRCNACGAFVVWFPGPPQAITPPLLADLISAGQWHGPYCPGTGVAG